jgi:hypothetical protein
MVLWSPWNVKHIFCITIFMANPSYFNVFNVFLHMSKICSIFHANYKEQKDQNCKNIITQKLSRNNDFIILGLVWHETQQWNYQDIFQIKDEFLMLIKKSNLDDNHDIKITCCLIYTKIMLQSTIQSEHLKKDKIRKCNCICRKFQTWKK